MRGNEAPDSGIRCGAKRKFRLHRNDGILLHGERVSAKAAAYRRAGICRACADGSVQGIEVDWDREAGTESWRSCAVIAPVGALAQK